eukprot:COSAG05_NODE_19063_length_298_cov_0.783920_1_plen_49_part_01
MGGAPADWEYKKHGAAAPLPAVVAPADVAIGATPAMPWEGGEQVAAVDD